MQPSKLNKPFNPTIAVRQLLPYCIVGIVAACLVIPYALLVQEVVQINSATISPTVWKRVGFSSGLAIITAIISLVLGGGLALWEYTKKVSASKWFIGIMLMPVFMPGIIIGTGFVGLLGKQGLMNTTLQLLAIEPIQLLYTPWAILLAFAYYNIPLAYLAVRSRLQQGNEQYDELVLTSGGNYWQVWRYSMWPRLRGSVIGIGSIIVLYSFTSFELPLVLGGIQYQTLEVYIYTVVTQQYNLSTAALLSLGQTVLLLGAIALASTVSQPWPETTQRSAHTTHWVIHITRAAVSLMLLAPIGTIISRALTVRSKGNVEWSVHNISTLLFETSYVAAWLQTMLMAAIVVVVVLSASIALTYTKQFTSWSIVGLLAISPIAISIGWRLYLAPSLIVAGLAFVALVFPLVSQLIMQRWNGRPRSFTETLRTLGASPTQQLWQRVLFNRPSMALGLGLIVAYLLGDIGVSSILLPYGQPSAMQLSYSLLSAYRFSVGDAGMAIIVLTIAAISSGSAYYYYAHRY